MRVPPEMTSTCRRKTAVQRHRPYRLVGQSTRYIHDLFMLTNCRMKVRNVGQSNTPDTSEQRSGENIEFNQQTKPHGSSDVGGKMGSESLIDSREEV
ncbi:hypothetical protein CC86DRAFT_21128 [Ophiobolus disseminans]|uniref:Uncharacterized protein n=1 Tax=Ophiobolus disseminans TaxID=1469910 RepID=A0A6A7A2Q5_9PLEO|nr:hypothetical protein CC86DRAFT_21128 [Ophiobolus disseminans]